MSKRRTDYLHFNRKYCAIKWIKRIIVYNFVNNVLKFIMLKPIKIIIIVPRGTEIYTHFAILTSRRICVSTHYSLLLGQLISIELCSLDLFYCAMLQQEGILSVLKNYFFRRKMSWNFVTSCYYYWKLTKLVVSINSYILSCNVLVLYMWKIIWIGFGSL